MRKLWFSHRHYFWWLRRRNVLHGATRAVEVYVNTERSEAWMSLRSIDRFIFFYVGWTHWLPWIRVTTLAFSLGLGGRDDDDRIY